MEIKSGYIPQQQVYNCLTVGTSGTFGDDVMIFEINLLNLKFLWDIRIEKYSRIEQ